MSVKHKIQIKLRQKLRRRQRKARLLEKGLNPNDFFYGKYYLSPKSFSFGTHRQEASSPQKESVSSNV